MGGRNLCLYFCNQKGISKQQQDIPEVEVSDLPAVSVSFDFFDIKIAGVCRYINNREYTDCFNPKVFLYNCKDCGYSNHNDFKFPCDEIFDRKVINERPLSQSGLFARYGTE